MRVLVTGACGYKGSVLVPKLLERGYDVVALDIMWFGNFLRPHPNMTVVQGDVRNTKDIDLSGIDAIIHLSSVANDPCGDLDPKLTWEISCLGDDAACRPCQASRRRALHICFLGKRVRVSATRRRSPKTSSSHHFPNTTRPRCAPNGLFCPMRTTWTVQIVRPATVCGYSPRMRLDVSVNMLTMQALKNGRITVFGGEQTRPNIHIDDITDLYVFLLDNPQHSGVFNAGFENISIMDIAHMVTQHVPAEITVTPSNDPRSYRVNSDKLLGNRVPAEEEGRRRDPRDCRSLWPRRAT